jgi:hypothetical protein
MATTVTITPGELNIRAKNGEVVSQLIDFSVDLTGYTFTARIVSAVTYTTVAALDVTSVNLGAGHVNVSLGQEDAGLAVGTYLWSFVWTPADGDPRTALEGTWEVIR